MYIGRGTKYGNPFSLDEHGRAGAMTKYVRYFLDRMRGVTEYPAGVWARAIWDLRGRILVCSCTPNPCHGDVIVEWIHAVDERFGIQEIFDNRPPTVEATDSGLIAVSGMLAHLEEPPIQSVMFRRHE